MLSLNVIGCGKLGKTIARLIKIHHSGIISGVKNSSLASAADAVQFIGEGQPCNTFQDLPPADLYFITTTDDQIQSTCEQLANEHRFKKDAVVAHTSGSLSSTILKSAKKQGCHTASIHPLKSFANPEQGVTDFTGTLCAIEGDTKAVTFLTTLFEKMGGIVFPVNKDQKALYHAACVIANNYLVTLHHAAFKCFQQAGLDMATAKKITSLLAKNSLDNLETLTHQTALTGPLQRGDIQTVLSHLQTLNSDVAIKNIYSILGLATLPLTDHDEQTKSALEKIFLKNL